MRAVVVEDAGRIAVREVPQPGLHGPYDALTKNICGCLCNGPDLKIYRRRRPATKDYPTILGHEAVGRIIEVGPKVRSFRIGDLVSRPSASPSPESGLFESWGGFAEYGRVTDTAAMAEDGLTEAVPNQLTAPHDFDPVAFSQMVTLRETSAFLGALGVAAGDSIIIIGAGPVGISFSLFARQLGLSPVIVVGRRTVPLERALSFGRATHVVDNSREQVPEAVLRITGGQGVDWAIEAIGTDAVLPDATASLKETGWLGLYGGPAVGDGTSPLRNSERVKRVAFHEATVHQTVLDWVSQGLIPAREFVSHELPMSEVERGLELLEKKDAFKVLLWIDQQSWPPS